MGITVRRFRTMEAGLIEKILKELGLPPPPPQHHGYNTRKSIKKNEYLNFFTPKNCFIHYEGANSEKLIFL
jgi:hypothetical protein